uniref:Formin-like protein n=1 Tax=Oryza glumipatula TaxID=40148 RepID=A0A0E0AM72_9ORYZ
MLHHHLHFQLHALMLRHRPHHLQQHILMPLLHRHHRLSHVQEHHLPHLHPLALHLHHHLQVHVQVLHLLHHLQVLAQVLHHLHPLQVVVQVLHLLLLQVAVQVLHLLHPLQAHVLELHLPRHHLELVGEHLHHRLPLGEGSVVLPHLHLLVDVHHLLLEDQEHHHLQEAILVEGVGWYVLQDQVLGLQLHVTRALQGSLWEELQRNDDSQSVSEFDLSELESLFPAAVPKPNDSSKSDSRRKSLGSKPEKVHLIELRRANNTEIMLTKVKMPLPDLVSAALALDQSTLDVDQVENLIKFCPTKEEMELLKNYTGDKENLGKCEQFFLELMKVPRMESKLRVFSFKIQFGSQVADLRKSLNTIDSSCDEIRSSLKLKEIMKKILLLGNTLNQGTARGAAVGFRLDSLLKLTDTRATNNKMTLMHYLCKVLAAKSSQLLDFYMDLVSLEATSKIQLKMLAEEMQAVSKGLEKVQLEYNASESDGPVSEIFREKLKEFTDNAGADVQSLSSLFSEVGKKADALIKYFGEDPVRCPFEQVISTLLTFVTMFRKAHEENRKQAELDKKRVEKEAEAEKSKAQLASKNDSKPSNPSRQVKQTPDTKTRAASRRGKDVVRTSDGRFFSLRPAGPPSGNF